VSVIGSGGVSEKLFWTPSMSVGIEKIDYQHKELFCLVNDLIDLVDEEMDSDGFVGAFKFLEGYVIDHFGEEERYMEIFSYPGIKEHKEQHALFKRTLADMEDRYREFGATEPFLKILKSQLVAWIFTHVKNVDGKLGKYLKGKTIDNV
jgi:hemerythrin